jgi:hypothetical protein
MSRRGNSGRRVALVALVALGSGLLAVGLNRPTAGFADSMVRPGLDAAATSRAASNGAAPVPASAAAAIALTAIAETSLGLPVPASRSVEQVTDPTTGMALDEVTDFDAGGEPIGISNFDTRGQLMSSVRLGIVAPTDAPISAASAARSAAAILASIGVAASGRAAVTPRAAGGWLVRWVRLVQAVPVPGDGVGVQVAGDGSFHAMVRTEHALAAAPAVAIDPARIRLLTRTRLDLWLPANVRGRASISSPSLAWVAPNDTFGDAIPAGPPGVLRLAWIVRVTTSGPLVHRLAGLELAFDAGDGTPLGGDLVE